MKKEKTMRLIKELGNMTGKVVAITGGAGHIGFAMASALAEVGASIVVMDIDEKRCDEAVNLLSAQYSGDHRAIKVDLSSAASIEEALAEINDHFGYLDVLINSAAMVGSSDLKGWATTFDEQGIDAWKMAMEINLDSVFLLVQGALPLMEERNSASIINVSSIYGLAGQKPSMYEGMDYITPAAYAASKGGIIQFTRYLATVLPKNIRVNCISPGGVERGQPEGFIEKYEALTPMNRMATEEDFKGVAYFLASDLSAYVTGQNIIVDGGWTL